MARNRAKLRKTQQIVVARLPQVVRPAKRRRRIGRNLRNRMNTVGGVDPFVSCVYGPVTHNGTGEGAPDGSGDPTVVVEHRQTIVVTPVSGNISVALVSSPYGAIGLGVGTAQVSLSRTDNLGAVVPGYVGIFTGTLTRGPIVQPGDNYSVLPFSESIRTGGSLQDFNAGGMVPTHYRVLTSQAKATFTGSTFLDSGTAATCRVAYGIDEDINNPYGDPLGTGAVAVFRGNRFPSEPPAGFAAVAAAPGSRVFSVREAAILMNAPTRLDFQEMRESWAPFTESNDSATTPGVTSLWFAGTAYKDLPAPVGPFAVPNPGLGYAPITFYSATGMDTSTGPSSVTFEVRTCVEYRLSFLSPSSRFARMPPLERPLAIQAVRNIARNLPSSAPVTAGTESDGWLGNALGWYGNTMKTIIGGAWAVGGRLVQTILPGGAGQAVGQGITQSGYALSGSGTQRAIRY